MTLVDIIKSYKDSNDFGSKEMLLKLEDSVNNLGFNANNCGEVLYNQFGADDEILCFINSWCKLLKNRLGDGDDRYQDSARRCKLYCYVAGGSQNPFAGNGDNKDNKAGNIKLLHHTLIQRLSSVWFKYLDMCGKDANLSERYSYLKGVRDAMVATFGRDWYDMFYI